MADQLELGSGRWIGSVNGPQGDIFQLEMSLEAKEGSISGNYRLPKGDSPWGDANSGEVTGRYSDAGQVRIEFTKLNRAAFLDGTYLSAAPRADQAMFGIVTAITPKGPRIAGVLSLFLHPRKQTDLEAAWES
jgi:hypothetical protein